MKRTALFCIIVAVMATQRATAEEFHGGEIHNGELNRDGFHREELRIAMPAAGPNGLEALLIRPSGPRRYPLALISHGASSEAAERQEMSPYGFYRQGIEFARRGFAALVVMRRGYGASPGSYAEGHSCCELATYLRSAKESADDLRAAIAAMNGRGDVATQGMIAVGVSGGGLASIALSVNPPPGLAAVISFAGGLLRAQHSANDPRSASDEAGLIEAFRTLGQGSRTPMLWVYAANDSYFKPELVRHLSAAFSSGGGRAELIEAPAFGTDGHRLFSAGIAMWPEPVDNFLREQNLGLRVLLPPPTLPVLPAPPRLSEKGRAAFTDYLTAGPHKAFAAAPGGAFGYWTGTRSLQKAKDEALGSCTRIAPDCTLYAIDDALAATEASSRK
jgi:dienelactone hydrolase